MITRTTVSSRDRLLAALDNDKADRMPCQVHSWMTYYRNTYLDGRDQYEAYAYFPGIDWVIYQEPKYIYRDADLAKWQTSISDRYRDDEGNYHWTEHYETPDGTLHQVYQENQFTQWRTEHIIKTEKDFEIWAKHVPIPTSVDWTPVIDAKNRIGGKGIVRASYFGFGQGSPWQDFCYLFGTLEAIMATFDNPEWVRHVLDTILEKKLRVIELGGKIELDLVETGGGAGSSTVISPTLHRDYCLSYDRIEHAALHDAGTKIVYHLCGGLMPLLDLVVENGADGLETMTPPSMGGDCDLAEANRRVGDKIFFIGGFDQNQGFESGTPEIAAELARACHAACPDGGYICSPSDHFFFGDPKNIQAFVDEANHCFY